MPTMKTSKVLVLLVLLSFLTGTITFGSPNRLAECASANGGPADYSTLCWPPAAPATGIALVAVSQPMNQSVVVVSETVEGLNDMLAGALQVTGAPEPRRVSFAIQSGGSISGRVLDEHQTPIPHVNIIARRCDQPDTIFRATTNADGQYTITGLASGYYWVEAFRFGWVRQYYSGKLNHLVADRVHVPATASADGIDFILVRGGSISGQIVDESGNRLSHASVLVISSGLTLGMEVWGGTFTIGGLPSGNYVLSASAKGRMTQYYDGAWSYLGATPITVTAPEEVSGITLTLWTSPSISGRVVDSQGNPIVGAAVQAARQGTEIRLDQVFTDHTGKYSISIQEVGDYRVEVTAAGWATASRLVTIAGPQGATGVDFALGRGASISGRVVDEEGRPVGGAKVTVSVWGYSQVVATALTGPDGTYTVTGLSAGEYRVQADKEGRATQHYRDSRVAEFAVRLSVSDGVSTGGIDFTLYPGAKIAGRVTDESGNPVEGGIVSAFHNDIGYAGGHVSFTKGYYEIRGLPYGEYRVMVSSPGWPLTYYHRQGSVALRFEDATPVELGAQGASGIDITLRKGGSISGRVLDEAGNPVPDARVQLQYENDTSLTKSYAVNSDGTYVISNLAPGNYVVFASKAGRRTQYYERTWSREDASQVVVTFGAHRRDVDFTLWPDTVVPVTGVSLDPGSITLTAGGAPVTVVATVEPASATNPAVSWSSSDETVATVSGGAVTPHASGTAVITVTTVDGGHTATCHVTVRDNASAEDLKKLRAASHLLATGPSLEIAAGDGEAAQGIVVANEVLQELRTDGKSLVVIAPTACIAFTSEQANAVLEVDGSSRLIITVEAFDASALPLPGQRRLVGTAVEICARVEATQGEYRDLAGRVRLAIPYSPEAVGNPQRLGVYRFEGNEWRYVGGKTDVARHLVTVDLEGLSAYALFEDERSFPDLAGHWAREDVEYIAARYIIQGMPDGSYQPEGLVTRAQFAAMAANVVRFARLDDGGAQDPNFADVQEDAWYAEAVRQGKSGASARLS